MNYSNFRAVLLGMGLLMCSSAGAFSGEVSSIYSSLALEKCTLIEEEPEFGTSTWKCEGQAGYAVYPTEADLRFYLAFGKNGALATTGGETVPPFNRLGATMEWRVENKGGVWTPFATIVRYYYSGGTGEPEGQVLVVSKFENGETCPVGYINALTSKNANLLARQLADRAARDFLCSTDRSTYVGEGANELW